MTNCEILMLVADDNNATLCTNTDGMTRVIRSIERAPMPGSSQDGETPIDRRHIFACELMMALSRCVSERICDGVVIFAEAAMMDELRQVQTSAVSRLIVAHIVGKPSHDNMFPGHGVANAVYSAGVQ